MNNEPRAFLTVDSGGSLPMGPLSVEVFPEGDDPIEFVLSSNHQKHELEVPPGRYAVIARRPNGARLRRSVVLKPGEKSAVNFLKDIPSSPNEFMTPETFRGEVVPGPIVEEFGRQRGILQGFGGKALESVALGRAYSGTVSPGKEGSSWRVVVWGQRGADVAQLKFESGVSFLKIQTQSHCSAVGMVDERGFGPVVITPAFRQPLEITFLAEALALRAAERFLNPSGQRSPVALVTPREPQAADLLSALASPTVEQADAIWDQSTNSVVNARDYVEGKFEHPTEALLGAHYLLRFSPRRLPLRWADNLKTALPDAADGPVIAAWLRLQSREEHVRTFGVEQLARDAQLLFEEACSRPVTLFARTRRLLVDGLRLYPEMSAGTGRKGASPLDFLSYGAHAGGVEAFWGSDPVTPGPAEPSSDLPHMEVGRVRLVGSSFDRAG